MSRFESRPPYVIFHDDKPGQHATLFGGGGRRFIFCGEASSFDDRACRYAWAFEGEARPGEQLVFATEDREVAGTIDSDAKEAVELLVARDGGKPERLIAKPVLITPSTTTVYTRTLARFG
jgi:hypothetical protein